MLALDAMAMGQFGMDAVDGRALRMVPSFERTVVAVRDGGVRRNCATVRRAGRDMLDDSVIGARSSACSGGSRTV